MFFKRGHANRVSPAVSMQRCCVLQVIWECRRLVFRILHREYSFRLPFPSRVWSVDITEWHIDGSLKRIASLVILLFKSFSEFRLMMVTDGYTGVFLQLKNRHQCTLAKWGNSTVVIQASAVKKSRNKNVNTATCYGGVRVHHQFYDPSALQWHHWSCLKSAEENGLANDLPHRTKHVVKNHLKSRRWPWQICWQMYGLQFWSQSI